MKHRWSLDISMGNNLEMNFFTLFQEYTKNEVEFCACVDANQ